MPVMVDATVIDETAGQPPEHVPASLRDYVRIVARGPNLSRPLTQEEATAAMRIILDDKADPIQLGAFLAVLRLRQETPEEFAGFVLAAREQFNAPDNAGVDLDWPSYADNHKQVPYFVLAALLLAAAGVRVLMHGLTGVGPVTTPAVLSALGIQPARSFDAAMAALDTACFAYIPTANFCPSVDRLFAIKPVLGLRSPANTFARALNPLNAPCQMQGVFHPTYIEPHRQTARLLGQPKAAIFKGGAGEVQCNPEKVCRVAVIENGRTMEEEWPPRVFQDHYDWRAETLDPVRVAALWEGTLELECPTQAIIGTAAIALKLLGRATTQSEAADLASELWRSRDRSRFK